ncbi:MAG: hypothetical protein ABW168_15295 [Sedimenticola sp.]
MESRGQRSVALDTRLRGYDGKEGSSTTVSSNLCRDDHGIKLKLMTLTPEFWITVLNSYVFLN